ncbi:hypothetical protein C478_10618 [Natrinema thermotolerans DSM 11552]|nr:hypothetical protein C478_10618 [Natrinema thermotolerans DSM 11552]
MSVTDTPRFEDLEADGHPRDKWAERSPKPSLNPRIAWLEAVPIDYPSMSPPAKYARFHEVTELIILANEYRLVTFIPLEDRPQDEQQYIRSQVSDR